MAAPTRTPSRFVRLARISKAHPWRTFGVWLLALVLLQVVASSVGKKEISNFRLPGTESQRAYDLLSQHFPAQKGDTDQLVFKARTGTLADPANKARITTALAKVADEPPVGSVVSPFAPAGRLTKDKRIGVALINYKKNINDIKLAPLQKVQDAAFTARSPQLQVEHGGPGAEQVRFGQGGPSEGIGILAAAIVLLLTFGSLVAASLPLISTLLALGATLGVITLISHLVDTPDFATQLATLIGLGVGIDYSLFVVTRFRAEVRAGMPRTDAVDRAIDTAGRTVMFAAITVVIALLGLLLLGLSFMHGVAIGAASAVLATMLAALTITPALVNGSKGFMDGVLHEYDVRGGFRFWGTKRRIPLPGRKWRTRRAARREERAGEREGWARWTGFVQSRPWPAIVLSLAVLVTLMLPLFHLRLGSSDAGVDPPGSTTRAAYHLIADGFGAGTNGSFLFVAKLPKDHADAPQQIASALKRDTDFTFVAPPATSPDGQVATVTAYPRTGPQDKATTDTLKRVRNEVVPAIEQRTGTTIEVGGFTASNGDFSRVVAGKLPVFIGVVVLLSALLLLVVFRSAVIPVKAAAMNLLSIGAALGFVTLIFQQGHGAGLLGIGVGPIESFVPVLMFAIVFGLSMDYEVFLMSRIHESWEHTRDASASVANGMQTTGRVITAAASIMVLVFGSFALGEDRVIKEFGIGLASAVLFDAFIIRLLLVPAVMEILGRRAWWLPRWLDRRMPRLSVEGPGAGA
jgi:putative drug exporter of the RND superfamily